MNESFVLYLPTYSLRFKLFRSIDQWYLHSLASWWIIRRRLLFSPPPPLYPFSAMESIFLLKRVVSHASHTHTRAFSTNFGQRWKSRLVQTLVFPLFFNFFFFFCELGFRKVGKTAIWLNVSPQFRNDEGSPCHDWYAFHARIPTEDHRFKWLN